MTKLFVTGSTGFIGGDALYAIVTTHPEYEITALVRNSDKGAQVAAQHPSIKFVYGDLDSEIILEEEAKKADVVCHFAHADHEVAARAMIKGIIAGHSTENPGFLIHTSGTGILLFADIRSQTFGEALGQDVYDDLEGVAAVTSLPDDAPHREVDKIVLAAGTEHAGSVKTAIVCPPTIYGTGRGPAKTRSHQVPELARSTLEKGHGIQVNAGQTYWGNVHIHDLSALYLKLVEEAAAGGKTADWQGKPAVWGAEGYYFCENGEHVWGDVSKWIAAEAYKQGLITSDEVKNMSIEEANKCTPQGAALWGANSRAVAKRAKAVLNWEPKFASLKDTIKEAVELEGKNLGLVKGHAEKAAGKA
ncbi:NAD(P)-binding protein [Acrodontium crateriforme]|uniref:NAD(P)-binding protein n=1 Tax=Acrodontium crateriforme TaxID=150365 RepID=A0AAQ3M8L3_9PEZI|nr:NAD(P)-binding protein [Acrodontium crateriforme]